VSDIKSIKLPGTDDKDMEFRPGEIYLARLKHSGELRLVFSDVGSIHPNGRIDSSGLKSYEPIKKVTNKVRIIIDD